MANWNQLAAVPLALLPHIGYSTSGYHSSIFAAHDQIAGIYTLLLAMGRSKVPDSERRRATRACTLCRAAKKKCSASIPCTYCRQRGLAASCFVTNNNGRQSSKETNSLSNDQESLSISDSPVQHAQYHADIVPGATHSGYQEGQPSVIGDGALAEMNLSKSPSGIPVQIESQRRASDDVNVGEEPIFRPRLLLNLQGEQGMECSKQHVI
jgi:hypothetical protein